MKQVGQKIIIHQSLGVAGYVVGGICPLFRKKADLCPVKTRSFKMKKYYLSVVCFALALAGATAQESSPKPVVARPVYFDVSPPLRDMVKETPGVTDRSWKDGVVPNKFGSDVDASIANGPVVGADPSLQGQFGMIATDTIISNFDGLWNVGGFVPPDTYGEAGPNHYFQVVNCSYAIFNKAGGRIFGPVANSSVWNGMPNNENSGDAVVLYDENANRWLFTQFSLPHYPSGPFYQMIAVSQTADPTGSWYRYQYEFPNMPDYPKFGVWPDAYYMSSNDFASGAGWVGNGAYAYDRSAMLAGSPTAERIGFTLSPGGAGFITLYPADCDGTFPAAGTPNYFGYVKLGSPQKFGIYEFHADFANPGASTFGNLLNLDVTPFNLLADGIQQKGTNIRLESLHDRLMYRLQYRTFNGYSAMVINHTVSAGGGRSGIRWYEFRKSAGPWSIYQQSTYAPADENSRWMGSIAMDTAGSIALGFSVSGPNLYPSVSYAGRKKNDPLNQMSIAERMIIPGGGCQTGSWSGRSRWGDYSGLSIDPDAPTTFWFTTEYYETTSVSSWKTRIASFTFDNNFSTSASATPSTFCIGDTTQLEANAYGGNGVYTYSWSSVPPGFTSDLKNPVVIPTDSTRYIVATSDGSQTHQDTAWVNVVPLPTGSAGNDTTICVWTDAVDLAGTATNYKHFIWGSVGDGIFSDKYSLATTYFPGPGDREAGGVDLKLVVFSISPCSGKIFLNKHITIDACTGIPVTTNPKMELTVMPNPANTQVTVTLSMPGDKEGQLSFISMDGRICYESAVRSDGRETPRVIDVSGFGKGIYLVRLQSDKAVVSRRLVIE